jgi:hypothetical protein
MPAVSDANRPRRFGRETRQELISRGQFCEQVTKQGWLPGEPRRDLEVRASRPPTDIPPTECDLLMTHSHAGRIHGGAPDTLDGRIG